MLEIQTELKLSPHFITPKLKIASLHTDGSTENLTQNLASLYINRSNRRLTYPRNRPAVIRGFIRTSMSSPTCTKKSTKSHILYNRTANPNSNTRTLKSFDVVYEANSLIFLYEVSIRVDAESVPEDTSASRTRNAVMLRYHPVPVQTAPGQRQFTDRDNESLFEVAGATVGRRVHPQPRDATSEDDGPATLDPNAIRRVEAAQVV